MTGRKPPYYENPDDSRYQPPEVTISKQYRRDMRDNSFDQYVFSNGLQVKFHANGKIELGQWHRNARIVQVRNYDRGDSNAGWFIELYPEALDGPGEPDDQGDAP